MGASLGENSRWDRSGPDLDIEVDAVVRFEKRGAGVVGGRAERNGERDLRDAGVACAGLSHLKRGARFGNKNNNPG